MSANAGRAAATASGAEQLISIAAAPASIAACAPSATVSPERSTVPFASSTVSAVHTVLPLSRAAMVAARASAAEAIVSHRNRSTWSACAATIPAVIRESDIVGRRQLGPVGGDERRQAAGDADVPPALVAGGSCRGDGGAMQRIEHRGLAGAGKPVRGGGVAVHGDHKRAGRDEIEMHGFDQLRLIDHDLHRPQRRCRPRAPLVQFLAHAAIEKEDISVARRRRHDHGPDLAPRRSRDDGLVRHGIA